MNVQPVIPFPLNEDWNLISRTIMPITYQNDIAGPPATSSGLATRAEPFLSQKPGPGGIIWGVGPVFLLPTATDELLGSGNGGQARPAWR